MSSGPRRITPQEYLAAEELAETKHEYYDGVVLDMSGASLAHGAITSNLSGAFFNLLKGGPCRGFSSDVKVRSRDQHTYSYPDFTLVCGEPQKAPDSDHVLINPSVIFEVLSPSTEALDRGKKFHKYQTIESLQEYVLVSQFEPRIEVFTRTEGETWLIRSFEGLESRAELASIGLSVPLADVYDRVEFPPTGVVIQELHP